MTLADDEDPEEPGEPGNLLAQYIDDCRRDRVDCRYRRLGEREQRDLTDEVIEAAMQLCGEARRLTGMDH